MGLTASVLAIDAGNSKTDVAVVAADGRVLATARGDGFRPPAVGVTAAVDALADTVTRAYTAAGVDSAVHVSACLANADLPVEEEQLAAALHARAWGTSVDVRNDTFAILRAGVADPGGWPSSAVAGINCVGMRPDGRTARFPALGRLSGDWGGGWGLAEEAIWHAARAEDGRGGPTVLTDALPSHFGLPSMYALIEALHLEHIAPSRRHELTPVLFGAARDGDAVARTIVDRLAQEVVSMATVALTRLDLLEEETPVLLGEAFSPRDTGNWTTGYGNSWPRGRRRRWRASYGSARCWGPRCWAWTGWGRTPTCNEGCAATSTPGE